MAPASVLGLRFVAAFAWLALGPLLLWELLAATGPMPARAQLETGMLAFVLAGVGVLVFARWQPPAWPVAPWRLQLVLRSYLPFVLAWVPLVVGYLWLLRRAGVAVPPQPALAYLAAADPTAPGSWVVVLGIVVAAPVAEEIVFRGYLQGALLAAVPPKAALVATAALFGLVHTLPYALPIALLGGLFGWLAVRHRSLGPAIAAHMLHNAVTVVVTVLWPESLDLLYPR